MHLLTCLIMCVISQLHHEVPNHHQEACILSHYHSLKNVSSTHHAFTVCLTHNTEPKSYLEACKFECWQKAMDDELEALTKTGTWVIVDLPSHIKPIGSKWVYKVKYKADG